MATGLMDRVEAGAQRMAAGAKDGSLIVDGIKYLLTFDSAAWVYVVSEPSDPEVVRFNTKSLQTARKYLREYLAA